MWLTVHAGTLILALAWFANVCSGTKAGAVSATSTMLTITHYDALVKGAESLFHGQVTGAGVSWEEVAVAFERALQSAGMGGLVSRGVSSMGSLLPASPAKVAMDVLCDSKVTAEAHRSRFPYLSMGLAYKGLAEEADSGHPQLIESLELSLLSLLRAVEGSPKSAQTWHELGTVSTAFLRRGSGLGGPDFASYNATSPTFHRLLLAFAESRYVGAAVRSRAGKSRGEDELLATTLEDLMFSVALHSLQRAHRLDPLRAATCNNLAIAHVMVGESSWHKAITFFKRAIGLHMAKIWAGKGEARHEEADARMLGLCAARRNFGSLLSRMGFHLEAEKQLRSVASSCPGGVRIGIDEIPSGEM